MDLVFPDIVLEELKTQYIEEYQKQIQKVKDIKKKKDFPGISLNYDEDIDIETLSIELLRSLRTELSEKHSILTNTNMEEVSFSSILKRALEKRGPFEGKKDNLIKGLRMQFCGRTFYHIKKNSLNIK